MLMEKIDQILTCFKSLLGLISFCFVAFSSSFRRYFSFTCLINLPRWIPTQEESVQCDFERMPCVDTLQLILHDILEVVDWGEVMGSLWCPVRAGWLPKDQGLLVFFQDDRRIIDSVYVPGFMLRAPCLISHLIFATTRWRRWQCCCSYLLHCGLQVSETLGQSIWKCTVSHLAALATWWSMLPSLCPSKGKICTVILFFHWKFEESGPIYYWVLQKSLQSRGRARLWKARVISSNNSLDRMNYMFIKVNIRPGSFK